MSSASTIRPSDEYVQEILRHESVLRASLYRFTRNSSDVDEMLQEVYLRLLSADMVKRMQVSSIRSVKAFALTIARNLALDALRHKKILSIESIEDIESFDALDEGEQVEETVNTHQELDRVAAAVESLPAKCREVFTLRKVYGLSQKEIAARLGISENTVEQHLAKGLRRCTKMIELGLDAASSSKLLERLGKRAIV